jgi:hypothetical protein
VQGTSILVPWYRLGDDGTNNPNYVEEDNRVPLLMEEGQQQDRRDDVVQEIDMTPLCLTLIRNPKVSCVGIAKLGSAHREWHKA